MINLLIFCFLALALPSCQREQTSNARDRSSDTQQASPFPFGGGSESMIIAPVVIEAKIIGGWGHGQSNDYDITVLKVIRNTISAELDSPMKVSRESFVPQPDLYKTYTLDLDYYSPAHPEYGLRIVAFKAK